MNIDFADDALRELYEMGSTKNNRYKYRLLFNSSENECHIVVNALLTEISKHYED